MKKRMGAALLLLTLGALVVTSLGDAARTATKPFDPTCGAARAKQRTVNGTLGSLTISGTPTRVVALEFSFVDDLAAIGVKPVGIADDNDATRIIPGVREVGVEHLDVGERQVERPLRLRASNRLNIRHRAIQAGGARQSRPARSTLLPRRYPRFRGVEERGGNTLILEWAGGGSNSQPAD